MPAPPAANSPPRAAASLPIVVLVSGQGSNLQAIIDRSPALGYDVRAVISDRPQAYALERASAAGIKTQVIIPAEYPSRNQYDAALLAAVHAAAPALVVLAGFMRLLSDDFVRRFHGRLLNIHPSLLPKYRGLHTHRRVLDAGDSRHGCSVHFVSEELDAGAVIAQAEVPVRPGDDESTLRARVQAREHFVYPEVIGWYAAGRVRLADAGVMFDGAPLSMPKMFPWKEGG